MSESKFGSLKNKPIIIGIMAVVSPIPLFIFTILWFLWYFGNGMGLLSYVPVPQWIILSFSLLPLLISPILGLLGIIGGIMKIKTKNAVLGILLSVVGLLENFLLIYGIYYIGSRF